MKYPKEYPVDEGLIAEAELLGSGADIRDINEALSYYKSYIHLYNEDNSQTNYWYQAVKQERILRGIVAESRINRAKELGRN